VRDQVSGVRGQGAGVAAPKAWSGMRRHGVIGSSSHRAAVSSALLFLVVLVLLAAASARAAVEGGWLQKGARKEVKVFTSRSKADKREDEIDRRGKVTIRRLIPKCHSDWGNDPTALPYFFYQVSLRTDGQFPVYVDNAGLEMTSEEIFKYPIIYFTSHFPFTLTDEEVQNLKKYVERGGTLWLDDCTGSGAFMDSVPQNVQRIAPGSELKLMLRETPEFFDLYNMVYPFDGVPIVGKEQFCRPLQAAYVKGRPAIIFCPNDYGCFWEISTPPTALNPMGEGAHGYLDEGGFKVRDIVYRFSINWLFYTLTH